MLLNRLNCLLCNSACIGSAPKSKYVAQFAVLVGKDETVSDCPCETLITSSTEYE